MIDLYKEPEYMFNEFNELYKYDPDLNDYTGMIYNENDLTDILINNILDNENIEIQINGIFIEQFVYNIFIRKSEWLDIIQFELYESYCSFNFPEIKYEHIIHHHHSNTHQNCRYLEFITKIFKYAEDYGPNDNFKSKIILRML